VLLLFWLRISLPRSLRLRRWQLLLYLLSLQEMKQAVVLELLQLSLQLLLLVLLLLLILLTTPYSGRRARRGTGTFGFAWIRTLHV
jgi:hypothetical protein